MTSSEINGCELCSCQDIAYLPVLRQVEIDPKGKVIAEQKAVMDGQKNSKYCKESQLKQTGNEMQDLRTNRETCSLKRRDLNESLRIMPLFSSSCCWTTVKREVQCEHRFLEDITIPQLRSST